MKQSPPTEIGLFTFRPEQTEKIVESLGFSVKSGYIISKDGKRAKYNCCGRDARVVHLGRVMPGSLELLCDDPICFNRYAITLLPK